MRLSCPVCEYENEIKGGTIPRTSFYYTCPKCGNVAQMLNYESTMGGSSRTPWFKIIGLIVSIVIVSVVAWHLSGEEEVTLQYIASYKLTPGEWIGSMELFDEGYPFELLIDSVSESDFSGSLVWTGVTPVYRRSIIGVHDGNHLVFYYNEDKGESSENQSGQAQHRNENKDVYIMNNRMIGTDMGGKAAFKAEKR